MGRVKPPDPVLLFIGTLYSDNKIFLQTQDILEKNFGNILFTSDPLKWDYTSYYNDELGYPLFRQFIFFKNLVNPGTLSEIKIKTNKIEDKLKKENNRCINLDPGYLTLSKIVLASTKNYAHRIYLGKGIYGEVTLFFKNGTYNPTIFTYRDYQDKSHIEIFMTARSYLKKILQ